MRELRQLPTPPDPVHMEALEDSELLSLGEEVRHALASKFHMLQFPRRLAQRFEQETAPARTRHLILGGVIGIFVYDLFLITDAFMVPDMLPITLAVRLGIVTPLTVLVIAILMRHRRMPAHIRETMEASITVLAGLTLTIFLRESRAPYAAFYFPGLLLALIFGNIVGQIRFWYALVATMLTVLLYVALAGANPLLPRPVFENNIVVLASTSLFTLFANYTLEYSFRRSYLLNLQERIQRMQLAAYSKELAMLSQIDPLTGLANRRGLDSYVEYYLRQHTPSTVAMLMVDVDYFKRYNDHYGHPAGDACLSKVAGALRTCLRHYSDIVVRLGGEEFAALIQNVDGEIAAQVAERMRLAVEQLEIEHEGSAVADHVTISIGLTVQRGLDLPALLDESDTALYRAKDAGRNCVRG